MSGRHAVAVSLAMLGVLGAAAYFLEHRKRSGQYKAAVLDASKLGGALTGFFYAGADPQSADLNPKGMYLDPTKEV